MVAPGYYAVSAMGAGYGQGATCAVYATAGTSMACPAAAGAALLVREYLSGSVHGGGAADQRCIDLLTLTLRRLRAPSTTPRARSLNFV